MTDILITPCCPMCGGPVRRVDLPRTQVYGVAPAEGGPCVLSVWPDGSAPYASPPGCWTVWCSVDGDARNGSGSDKEPIPTYATVLPAGAVAEIVRLRASVAAPATATIPRVPSVWPEGSDPHARMPAVRARLPLAMLSALDDATVRTGLTRSEIIRAALAAWLGTLSLWPPGAP